MPGEDGFNAEDAKIYQRELQRLEISLRYARVPEDGRLIAALHFPIFNSKGVFSGFLDIMQKYNVHLCIYGHLHGAAHKHAVEGLVRGIEFRLVAADHICFKPVKIL